MDERLPETKRLRRDVEWALQRALDPGAVLPMLHRLARLAAPGSDESLYAQRRLAELLVERHPWRAALAARRVLAAQPGDDGAWSLLGLAYALLGHYRCAVRAYLRASEIAPANATYAHNLGHLVDVALGRPNDALAWLQAAYEKTGGRADVAVSLAHALGRAGSITEAKAVIQRALRSRDGTNLREHAALARWLEEGAPEATRLLPHHPPAMTTTWGEPRTRPQTWTKRSRRGRGAATEGLGDVLQRGLARLPLDEGQRERALALGREPAVTSAVPPDSDSLASVGAAIAYSIVHADSVPLTQAEVAASFRVSVPALRGRYKTLRAFLGHTLRETRTSGR